MVEVVRRVLDEVKDVSYEEYLRDSRLQRTILYGPQCFRRGERAGF